jgi:hypothetical protein
LPSPAPEGVDRIEAYRHWRKAMAIAGFTVGDVEHKPRERPRVRTELPTVFNPVDGLVCGLGFIRSIRERATAQ